MENLLTNKSLDIYNGGSPYVHHIRYFHAHFNEIPNIKSVLNVNTLKIKKFLFENFKDNIIQYNYQIDVSINKRDTIEDFFLILKDKIVINLYGKGFYILFNSKEEQQVNEIIKNVLKFGIKKKLTKEISFIINKNNSFTTKPIKLKTPKLNIAWHYNDDFKEIHLKVLGTLKKYNTKGLYLFYGEPGTGKSTYIKYLTQLQRKEVIFLSPKMAANLDNITFTEFLLENPNIILVIEDAEDLILSRNNKQNSQLSFLLNLTDGIIADSLGIQIIATFNTDLHNIDNALLRKGRLTTLYEFKKLNVEKAKFLAKQLKIDGFDTNIPMTLADIFNYTDKNNNECVKNKKIGF